MSLRVYAIVGRPLGRRLVMSGLGVRGAKVRSVSAGATSAVVAECKGPLSPTARALRGHDTVVRRIARVAPAVLPVRFGTLVDSDRSLVALLEAWSEDLQKALALVDRHSQMTLRLFALAGTPAPSEQSGPGEEADEADEAAAHPGTSYLTRRARAHAIAQSAPELEPLRDTFASIVAAERIVRHDHGPLVLTAYHLIPRSSVTTYRRLLQRHAAALPYRAVLSGPWPPYAFVPELRR
jgi:Gas vesicle synthesis protein GvpL/GvpF